MLTERLSIQSIPARFNVEAGRLDISFEQPDPFVDTQVSKTPYSSEITTTPASKVQISTLGVQEDLGFLRPNSFRQKMESLSASKATQGIAQRVSEGVAILQNPGRETLPRIIANRVGYEVQTRVAVRPGVQPEISFSEVSEVLSDFQPGSIQVEGNNDLQIDPQRTPPQVDLVEPGDVRIAVVPNGSNLDISV